ncbi:hypothetical protein ACIPXV_11525 [Streptomyces libani]|uniref:hypothetical protein n=1 Tax=Streptomyces nigrescens TaxID=1920 RepID=UPI0037FA7DAE
MFAHLRSLQRVVATGASSNSPAFHEVYHPYRAAVWAYRVAVRDELEGLPLSPAGFGWGEWDGKDRCALCGEAGAGGG